MKQMSLQQLMSIAIIIICIVFTSSVSPVIILQSTTSTSIVSPPNFHTIASGFGYQNGLAGPGVIWIQPKQQSIMTIFQSLFFINCGGNAKLSILAKNFFIAYLDGVQIGSGSYQSSIYTFPLKITCGSHNFTVVVKAESIPALTFAIDQDQSQCFNCQPIGFWNQKKCACECIKKPRESECISPQIWKNYPICRCGCPRQTFPFDPAAQISVPVPAPVPVPVETEGPDPPPSGIIPLLSSLCRYPMYYSQASCSCVKP